MKKQMTEVKKPTANLAINKSRLKIHNPESPTYYLKDGQEFQLELFNPTMTRVLAKIELNGTLISQGGIVLRQGERIFLERYIDIAKKFMFETYEVNLKDSEVKEAIQNNGSVKVYFYNEEVKPILTVSIPTIWNNPWINQWPNNNNGTGGTYYLSNIGTTTSGIVDSSSSLTFTNCSSGVANSNYVDSRGLTSSLAPSTFTQTTNAPSQSNSRDISRSIKKSIKKEETGRIELGDNSQQSFNTVNYNFNPYMSHVVEYKILPISQQIITKEDLQVKIYCHNCATKCTKGDKYCRACGTKQ